MFFRASLSFFDSVDESMISIFQSNKQKQV